MTAIVLRVKNVFDKEHANQQNYLLADVTLAVSAACAGSLVVFLSFGLLGALQSHSFPWSNYFGLVVEFLFIAAFLGAVLSLPALARYLSWRFLVSVLKLWVDRVRRSAQVHPAAICLPLTKFFENYRHRITAYWQQLRQRRAQRP